VAEERDIPLSQIRMRCESCWTSGAAAEFAPLTVTYLADDPEEWIIEGACPMCRETVTVIWDGWSVGKGRWIGDQLD
jgi:hypothetical protein